MIRCDIKRSFLAKDVSKSLEFIVEDKPKADKANARANKEQSKTVLFKIVPESLQNTRDRTNVPKFHITGRLDTLHCKISEPLTGEVHHFFFILLLLLCIINVLTYSLYLKVVIEHCEAVIKSIELQLVRVETCGCAEGYSRDGKKIIIEELYRNKI